MPGCRTRSRRKARCSLWWHQESRKYLSGKQAPPAGAGRRASPETSGIEFPWRVQVYAAFALFAVAAPAGPHPGIVDTYPVESIFFCQGRVQEESLLITGGIMVRMVALLEKTVARQWFFAIFRPQGTRG